METSAVPHKPERTPCTVWYADGHHVDLAIYRRAGFGLEHASGDTWSASDPEAVPFGSRRRIESISPKSAEDQFRRIVRWLKSFAKSRRSWNMPGGMILSALAAETYRPHATRDDVALLDTITALSSRLDLNIHVSNPVGGTLTGKQKYIDRVVFLREKLKWVLPKLEELRDPNSTHDDAKRAWRWFFNHSFWETPSTRNALLAETAGFPATIRIRAEIATGKGSKTKYEYRDGPAIPKGCWIRFTAEDRSLAPGDMFHWIVENTGDEAVGLDDLGHTKTNQSSQNWERTAYKGTHRMICEVRHGTRVVARGVRKVPIP